MTDQDTLPSAVGMLREVVDHSDLDHDRKNYFLGFLTETRFSEMTYDDAAELLKVMDKSLNKLEQEVLNTNDPDRINELTALKEFVNQSLYDAEMAALQSAAPGVDLLATEETSRDPQSLLDMLAGLAE